MKLCSACLLGKKCRYDGRSKPNKKIIELSKKEKLIPICPEQLSGLPTPRTPSEIQGGSGEGVLDGKCKVLSKDGEDVTKEFIKGAEEVLKRSKLTGIKEAILKQKSPYCGCGKIHNGTFSDTLVEGDGVTTALLKRNKIKIISEEDI